MTSMTEETQREVERAEYIAGLRTLADALESHPDALLPQHGLTVVTSWEEDPKEETRKFIRAVGGKWNKRQTGTDGTIMAFHRFFGSFKIEVLCNREQVCQRVVTGTREVTKIVPAPDAPMVEITETIEDVEWICEPLLAADSAVA